MNRPVSLLCGHSGCQERIHQLISTQCGGGREKAFAVCREPINEQMLNISIPLSSVISKLTVKCTNVGCTWVSMVLKRDVKRPAHSSFWNAPMAVMDRICEIHLSVTWRSALKRKYLASTALQRWRGICWISMNQPVKKSPDHVH